MPKHRKINIGDRFGMLEVLEPAGVGTYGNAAKKLMLYKCKCDCGTVKDIPGALLGRKINHCGCVPGKLRKINIGDRFGKLEVLASAGVCGHTKLTLYKCKCDCGTLKDIIGVYLGRKVNDCGCVPGKHRKINIGDRFGKLEVLELIGARTYGSKDLRMYKCKCDCGTLKDIPGVYLGKVVSDCGCLRRTNEKKIALGTVFGRLEVMNKIEEKIGGEYYYLCMCNCGESKKIRGSDLRKGRVKSCGCMSKERLNSYRKEVFVERTLLTLIASKKANKNSQTGVRGVYLTQSGKYEAKLEFQRKRYHLGTFETLEEAAAARKEGEEKYYKPILEKYNKVYKRDKQDD